MALFPRRVRGRFAALSRWDRESNSVAFSDDLRQWSSAAPVQLPDPGLGGAAARQLRVADRDRRRMARAHPRGRPDAHLQHRRAPPRPRRPDRRPEPAPTAAARTRPRRAGRLRAQRRVLLRRARPRRHARAALRDRRRRHRHRHACRCATCSPSSTARGSAEPGAGRRAGAHRVAVPAPALRPVGAVRLTADRGPRRPRP